MTTTAGSPSTPTRRTTTTLVAVVLAVLATLVAVGVRVDAHASTTGAPVAGNGVAAHELLAGPVVAAAEDVLAGEGRRTATGEPGTVVGSRVAPRAIGPAGDAGALGLARMDRFRNLADTGFDVAGEHYRLNPHAINSLRKSGRRQIDPESLIRSLDTMSGAGTPGSRAFTDPRTGTRWFVNDANEVVGVWPSGFKG